MKSRQYSAKQIAEAIRYWENILQESNEKDTLSKLLDMAKAVSPDIQKLTSEIQKAVGSEIKEDIDEDEIDDEIDDEKKQNIKELKHLAKLIGIPVGAYMGILLLIAMYYEVGYPYLCKKAHEKRTDSTEQRQAGTDTSKQDDNPYVNLTKAGLGGKKQYKEVFGRELEESSDGSEKAIAKQFVDAKGYLDEAIAKMSKVIHNSLDAISDDSTEAEKIKTQFDKIVAS